MVRKRDSTSHDYHEIEEKRKYHGKIKKEEKNGTIMKEKIRISVCGTA